MHKIWCKAVLDAAIKRETIHIGNKTKVYTLIWNRWVRSLQSKIQQRKDFELRIYNDPIELLKAIKDHALNYQETIYKIKITDDSLIIFLLLKQNEEPLHEYIARRHWESSMEKICRI